MALSRLNRRQFLRTAALGALTGAPGVRAEAGLRRPEGFTFAVLTDLHYRDERCGVWLRRVRASLEALRPRPAFVVLGGDLSEDGTAEQLAAVRHLFADLPMPVRTIIGNHDHTEAGDRSAYERIYGPELNQSFAHRGVQLLTLDTTQGRSVYRTRIPEATLHWVDATLPTIPQERPMIVLTHFPLGRNWLRPLNTRPLLEKFREHRLLATFSGHWHGITERDQSGVHLSTGRCCSWWRENHDGSEEKGYVLAEVAPGVVPSSAARDLTPFRSRRVSSRGTMTLLRDSSATDCDTTVADSGTAKRLKTGFTLLMMLGTSGADTFIRPVNSVSRSLHLVCLTLKSLHGQSAPTGPHPAFKFSRSCFT